MVALDASRAIQGRLSGGVDPGLRDELGAEARRHSDRHRQLSMLLNKINQWLFELKLPPGTTLQPAPRADIKRKNGQTLPEAITDVRGKISELNQQMIAVRSAPMRKSSQREAVIAYVASLAARAKPRIVFDVKGNAKMLWVEDMIVQKDDLVGTLALFLGPQKIAEVLAHQFEQEAERSDAVTPAERQEKIAELSASTLSLERREAALLEENGIDNILPRPEMDPRAFLGVIVATAQTQTKEVA
jgi:hypothetical protein